VTGDDKGCLFLFTQSKTLLRNLPVMNNLGFPSGLSVAGYQGAIRNPRSGVDGRQKTTEILYQSLKKDLHDSEKTRIISPKKCIHKNVFSCH
jgi:hypothetical protein